MTGEKKQKKKPKKTTVGHFHPPFVLASSEKIMYNISCFMTLKIKPLDL